MGAEVRDNTVSSLLFLGTGPGSPVPGRFCSSILLKSGGACVLVDAGEPCSLSLRQRGIPISDLDAVLVTHGHSDHTAGLPMLLQSAWLEKRRKLLPIYLPLELVDPLRAWLEAVYLPDKLLGFPLEFRPWHAGRREQVAEGVDVRPFPTTHLEGLRRIIDPAADGRFEVFGLEAECAGHRLVFSSDLGSPEDLRPVLADACDLLVSELSHFSPEELFASLRSCRIGRLFLNHLSPEFIGREKEILESARAALPQIGETRVVSDGDTVLF